jgi:hypothetical protein
MSRIVLKNCRFNAPLGVALSVAQNTKEVLIENTTDINGSLNITNASLTLKNVKNINVSGLYGIDFGTSIDTKYQYTLTVEGPLSINSSLGLKSTYSNLDIKNAFYLGDVDLAFCVGDLSNNTVAGVSTLDGCVVTLTNSELQSVTTNNSVITLNNTNVLGVLDTTTSTVYTNRGTLTSITTNNSALFNNNTTINSTIVLNTASSARMASSSATSTTSVDNGSSVEFFSTDSGTTTTTGGYAGMYGGTFSGATTGSLGVVFVAGASGGAVNTTVSGTTVWATGGSMVLDSNSFTQDVLLDYDLTVGNDRTDTVQNDFTLESVAGSISVLALAQTVQMQGSDSTFNLTSGSSTLAAVSVIINATTYEVNATTSVTYTSPTITYNATTVTI